MKINIWMRPHLYQRTLSSPVISGHSYLNTQQRGQLPLYQCSFSKGSHKWFYHSKRGNVKVVFTFSKESVTGGAVEDWQKCFQRPQSGSANLGRQHIWIRNCCICTIMILGMYSILYHPLVKDFIRFSPFGLYESAAKTMHFYTEWLSGDVAWSMQVGFSILKIIYILTVSVIGPASQGCNPSWGYTLIRWKDRYWFNKLKSQVIINQVLFYYFPSHFLLIITSFTDALYALLFTHMRTQSRVRIQHSSVAYFGL